MIELCITISQFQESDYAKVLGQERLTPTERLTDGTSEFFHSTDFDGVLKEKLELRGFFGEKEGGFGQCNYAITVGGVHLLNVGGFFSNIPLATGLYSDAIDCWISVHASLAAPSNGDQDASSE